MQSEHDCDPSHSYHGNMTPPSLHAAIDRADLELVVQALSGSSDVNLLYQWETPCTRAIKGGNMDIMAAIISHPNFDPNISNEPRNMSPLLLAIESGYTNIVTSLVARGADVNQSDLVNNTPLGKAVYHNHKEIVQLLMEGGAKVDAISGQGETPLYIACSNTHRELAAMLLKAGCNVNGSTSDSHSQPHRTPLMAAIPTMYSVTVAAKKRSEMIEIMNMLISSGCDLDVADIRGNTALHLAVEHRDLFAICVLLDRGANFDNLNQDGLTPFDIALSHEPPWYEAAMFLVLNGFVPKWTVEETKDSHQILMLFQQVHKAAQDSEEKQALLTTIFHALEFSQNLKRSIAVLLTKTNNKSHENETVTSLSSVEQNSPPKLQNCCRNVVRHSLGRAILARIKDLHLPGPVKDFLALGYRHRERNPLYLCDLQLAIEEGNIAKFHDLCTRILDLNHRLNGNTPLTLAAGGGNVYFVRKLLELGADPLSHDQSGDTAIHRAASGGFPDVVQCLLNVGVDICLENTSGEAAVSKAAENGRFSCLQYLLQKGGSANSPNQMGIYPVHFVTASGAAEMTSVVLESGGWVDQRDPFGNTALHVAASFGNIYTDRHIRLPALYAGEIAMQLDGLRHVMLRQPCRRYRRKQGVDHAAVVRLLLEAGSDKNLTNNDNHTAQHVNETLFRDKVITSYLTEP